MVQKCGPSLIFGGLLLLSTVLIVFLLVIPVVVDDMLKQELQLKNGSYVWGKWKDLPVPIFLKFYIFHIENPKAIENGERFRVKEKGPYVYEEKRYKEILEVNEEADTVTYEEYIHYYFREDLSKGNKENDLVSIVNVPFVAVSAILKKTIYGLANIPIDLLWKSGEFFVRENVTVRDLIFDGIDASIYLPLLNLKPGGAPPEFEGGSFAFYKNRNGTLDGVYTIKSGLKDHKTFGNIVGFNGMKELPYWTDPSLKPYEEQYCNKINGSDGTLMPPFLDKDHVVRIFNRDICRSIYLEFEKEIDYSGIPGYKYSIPTRMLWQPDKNPDNKCFCPSPGGGLADYCNIDGIFRVFPCRSGAPIALSLPHFLNGEDRLAEEVEGIKADSNIHESFFEAEPRSGMVLQAVKRIQINIEMEPLDGIAIFRNVSKPSSVVPILWAEESAALDETLVDELKGKLLKPLKIIKILQWSMIALCIGITLAGITKTILACREQQHTT